MIRTDNAHQRFGVRPQPRAFPSDVTIDQTSASDHGAHVQRHALHCRKPIDTTLKNCSRGVTTGAEAAQRTSGVDPDSASMPQGPCRLASVVDSPHVTMADISDMCDRD
jgi:hypothetical protein